MPPRHVLFLSGSIGLGHVTRDLAMAAELRRQCPGLRLEWLAGDPARQVLQAAGEDLVPESTQYAGETAFAETIAGDYSLRFTNPLTLFKSVKAWKALFQLARGQNKNVALFQDLTQRQPFDLIVADEAYELILALALRRIRKPSPLALIVDFVGNAPASFPLFPSGRTAPPPAPTCVPATPSLSAH